MLKEYKAQQAVKRRFPILKDPKRVGAVYLKNPDPVEAFGYLLILAVVAYSVIERRGRRTLVDADEPMWLVVGKKSFRPTGRRVLERFENMTMMQVDEDTRAILNDLYFTAQRTMGVMAGTLKWNKLSHCSPQMGRNLSLQQLSDEVVGRDR